MMIHMHEGNLNKIFVVFGKLLYNLVHRLALWSIPGDHNDHDHGDHDSDHDHDGDDHDGDHDGDDHDGDHDLDDHDKLLHIPSQFLVLPSRNLLRQKHIVNTNQDLHVPTAVHGR